VSGPNCLATPSRGAPRLRTVRGGHVRGSAFPYPEVLPAAVDRGAHCEKKFVSVFDPSAGGSRRERPLRANLLGETRGEKIDADPISPNIERHGETIGSSA
jgi:hypothetical protein